MKANQAPKKRARLCPQGELTIQHAAEYKQTLLAALDAEDALELDLSQIAELDSAGVQVLLLARRSADARKKQLMLSGPSPAVRETLELLELDSYLLDFEPPRRETQR